MNRSFGVGEPSSTPYLAAPARASATDGELDRLNAFQRLLDDGREIARGTTAAAIVELLDGALSAAFTTGAYVAWMRVYRALQFIEASCFDRSATATARARVRAFLAENADLAHHEELYAAGDQLAVELDATDASSAVPDRERSRDRGLRLAPPVRMISANLDKHKTTSCNIPQPLAELGPGEHRLNMP
jgi:hypothetical protein